MYLFERTDEFFVDAPCGDSKGIMQSQVAYDNDKLPDLKLLQFWQTFIAHATSDSQLT